jgi:hypothetical protein
MFLEQQDFKNKKNCNSFFSRRTEAVRTNCLSNKNPVPVGAA